MTKRLQSVYTFFDPDNLQARICIHLRHGDLLPTLNIRCAILEGWYGPAASTAAWGNLWIIRDVLCGNPSGAATKYHVQGMAVALARRDNTAKAPDRPCPKGLQGEPTAFAASD